MFKFQKLKVELKYEKRIIDLKVNYFLNRITYWLGTIITKNIANKIYWKLRYIYFLNLYYFTFRKYYRFFKKKFLLYKLNKFYLDNDIQKKSYISYFKPNKLNIYNKSYFKKKIKLVEKKKLQFFVKLLF